MKLLFLFILTVLLPKAPALQQKTSYKFFFGPVTEVPGYIKVNLIQKFSADVGYGFDFGTARFLLTVTGKTHSPADSAQAKNFFFSVVLPEGNYNIKVITGDNKEATNTTIRVESRRLIFEFTGTRPCICALKITKVEDAVTIYLAGNLMVVDQDDDPWASWGQMFPKVSETGNSSCKPC